MRWLDGILVWPIVSTSEALCMRMWYLTFDEISGTSIHQWIICYTWQTYRNRGSCSLVITEVLCYLMEFHRGWLMHKTYCKFGFIRESVVREVKPGHLTYKVQLTRMQNQLQSFQTTLCIWYKNKQINQPPHQKTTNQSKQPPQNLKTSR